MPAAPSQSGPSYLRCIGCGRAPAQAGAQWRCSECGELLELAFPQAWLSENSPAAWKALWRSRRTSLAAEDRSGVWRFRELLPILSSPAAAVTLQEGNTPLYELPVCAGGMEGVRLLAKHQGMNPTGSFKDTGMTAAVSQARAAGHDWVACASTGNTSASMAAYAARAGMRSLVLVPAGHITWSKLAQAMDAGAVTCQLRTDFDGCVRVLTELLPHLPLCLVNSVNPYRLEGQKTAAVEILEQLEWQVPEHVVVPGGNLANASALGKAFLEMSAQGFIEHLPRISIIQAEGANPLARSWRETQGRELVPVQPETRASAIRIGNPASWKKAVRVLQHTGGTCLDVAEAEIADAKAWLGRAGVACEPASAAAFAGARRLTKQGFIRPGETVVLLLTGHGLKDPDYTLAYFRGEIAGVATPRAAVELEADGGAVLRYLESL
jgi:threonine synthase